MKTIYQHASGATLRVEPLLMPQIPIWRIDNIEVPTSHRGQGIGTLLLLNCIADADTESIELELEARSTGDMTQAELMAWYSRHGFYHPTGTPSNVMRRIPAK
jgi:ribosomal protein S18 acetylase RimI-like enzyme